MSLLNAIRNKVVLRMVAVVDKQQPFKKPNRCCLKKLF